MTKLNPILPDAPAEKAVWRYLLRMGPLTPHLIRRRFRKVFSRKAVDAAVRSCLRKGLLVTDPLNLVYSGEPYGFADA